VDDLTHVGERDRFRGSLGLDVHPVAFELGTPVADRPGYDGLFAAIQARQLRVDSVEGLALDGIVFENGGRAVVVVDDGPLIVQDEGALRDTLGNGRLIGVTEAGEIAACVPEHAECEDGDADRFVVQQEYRAFVVVGYDVRSERQCSDRHE